MQLGSIQWIALAAILIGALVRLVKSDTVNAQLQKFGIPPIPKKALPFVAIALGVASAALQAKMQGATWQVALMGGVASSVAAIAGHETIVESLMGGAEPFGSASTPPAAATVPISSMMPGLATFVGLAFAGGLAASSAHAIVACTPQQVVQGATESVYLGGQLECIDEAGTRAAADACRKAEKEQLGLDAGAQ